MRSHRVAALPVLNRARRVIGIVTQSDFLEHGGLDDYGSIRQQLQRFLRKSGVTHTEKAEVVGQIMSAHPTTARVDTPIVDLVPLMADSGFHHIPIVDKSSDLSASSPSRTWWRRCTRAASRKRPHKKGRARGAANGVAHYCYCLFLRRASAPVRPSPANSMA
jgi:CBS domain-containing protein